jgi:uncharacterized membrane protein YhaH (DUF805 family)
MWAEVVVLLLAIAAFLFLGSLVARRLRAANKVFEFVGICVCMYLTIHIYTHMCVVEEVVCLTFPLRSGVGRHSGFYAHSLNQVDWHYRN